MLGAQEQTAAPAGPATPRPSAQRPGGKEPKGAMAGMVVVVAVDAVGRRTRSLPAAREV